MHALARWTGHRFHYAWVVAGAVFLALLTSAGVRSMPGVLLVPLEKDENIATALTLPPWPRIQPSSESLQEPRGTRPAALVATAPRAWAMARWRIT